MKVKFKKLNPNATIPYRATPGSAGFDLVALKDVDVPFGGTVAVSTGLAIEMPKNMEAQIRSRSGLAALGIVVANGVGTIDSDYRGEVKVLLFNNGSQHHTGIKHPYQLYHTITKGTRIAQMVFAELPEVAIEVVSDISETERGEGGFGSSGLTI